MDPISQGALGAAAAESVATRSKLRAWALLGCLAGMAPDVDVFIGSADDPLLFLEYHRQFTHALVFIPVGAMVVALVLHWAVRRTLTPMESYLACLAGYATPARPTARNFCGLSPTNASRGTTSPWSTRCSRCPSSGLSLPRR